MVEQFRNDTGHGIDIPRFGIYVVAGATFTVPDEDNGSLYNDPGFTNLAAAAGLALVDNGDGTVTVTGPAIVDNGDGTVTITDPSLVDNGDGTITLTA